MPHLSSFLRDGSRPLVPDLLHCGLGQGNGSGRFSLPLLLSAQLRRNHISFGIFVYACDSTKAMFQGKASSKDWCPAHINLLIPNPRVEVRAPAPPSAEVRGLGSLPPIWDTRIQSQASCFNLDQPWLLGKRPGPGVYLTLSPTLQKQQQ